MADIDAAVAALAAGSAIGLPTETVYGLAANAADREAVAAIYRIKGRPSDHPLIVHVLGRDEARQWAIWQDDAERLAAAFWPGPLTLVLPRLDGAPAWACAGQSTIGLRAPSHPVARAVLAGLAARGITGLAAPSANRFGRVSPTRADHVRADLGDDVALVLEGGDAEVGVESTIVDLSRDQPTVLRPGHLTVDDLSAALGRPVAGSDAPSQQPAPRVPGALASHYAPVTPLEMLAADRLPARLAAAVAAGERVVLWSRRPPADEARAAVSWFALPDAPAVLEHDLYARLRDFDAGGFDRMLIERPGEGPAWAAVLDRLSRAGVDRR